MKRFSPSLLALLLLTSCSTPNNVEPGPAGTIAYHVQIESSEPGARIEVNNDYAGKTPLTIKIFGDKDGTFHNFGTHEFVIRAYPVKTNQTVQTKVFRTGGWFSQEDRVPSRIYFDMDQKGGFTIDAPPRY